jgi:hypothetical protein
MRLILARPRGQLMVAFFASRRPLAFAYKTKGLEERYRFVTLISRFSKPNKCPIRFSKDVAHERHLMRFFRVIVLVNAQGVYPPPRLVALFAERPGEEWVDSIENECRLFV